MRGDLSRVRGLLRYYGIRLALVGLICWGVIAALSGPVARVVHLPSPAPIAMLGSVFVLFSVTHLQRGVLQGTQAFGRYGASAAFEGVVKVVTAAAILLLMLRTATAAVLIYGGVTVEGTQSSSTWLTFSRLSVPNWLATKIGPGCWNFGVTLIQ